MHTVCVVLKLTTLSTLCLETGNSFKEGGTAAHLEECAEGDRVLAGHRVVGGAVQEQHARQQLPIQARCRGIEQPPLKMTRTRDGCMWVPRHGGTR